VLRRIAGRHARQGAAAATRIGSRGRRDRFLQCKQYDERGAPSRGPAAARGWLPIAAGADGQAVSICAVSLIGMLQI
jgi:hypothetical protein